MHTYRKTYNYIKHIIHTINKKSEASQNLHILGTQYFEISLFHWSKKAVLKNTNTKAYEKLMKNLHYDSLCDELAGDRAAGESMLP